MDKVILQNGGTVEEGFNELEYSSEEFFQNTSLKDRKSTTKKLRDMQGRMRHQ